MGERQAAKGEMLYELSHLRLAFQPNHLLQDRGNGFHLIYSLSRHRHIIERPGLAVQKPLARRVQRLKDVLHVIRVSGREAEDADRALQGGGLPVY